MAGESDFVRWLRSRQLASEAVPVPAGDDLAVLNWRGEDLLVVGADQVLDGVHFDSKVHSPRQIGRKAMNRNLSDCAAMACEPAAAVATVALPTGAGEEFARELYLGLEEAGRAFGCAVVGGDTGSWGGFLAVSVMIIGRSNGIEPVLRRGARAGDGVWVSGPLGGSILGRHMDFTPRVNEARRWAGAGLVSAMIDVSDGLARDAGQIAAESGVAIELDAERIPIHADAVELAKRDGVSAMQHALNDGEDYELVFTSPAEPIGAVRIGEVVRGRGVRLRTAGGLVEVAGGGWEHRL